ncbi:universal stress protein [Halogeometricum sp. S1BR25-6]|uniref:Universal stress protein n=1 Tax=Halogeometricum salsisoli TaxID=2950536 RepID=A0ABU2GII3_9EURY|nr:universal stress protein [Halogeometricum sp. S1BR25-6]MDS0300642.1 universal stress protein [Halogeometricum sp. S1BR25-6]
MKQGLVVVEDSEEYRELLHEACEHASGADVDLLFLVTLTDEEYEADVETLESIKSVEDVSYDVFATAEKSVRDTVDDVLSEYEVEYDIVVRVVSDDKRAQAVVDVGDEEGCDHAFILGRQRSPTGKALFGDFAQKVILNFDGFVTIATA